MLVDGSYLVHTERILEALKRTRREAIREGRLKVHERMLQVILSAATLSSQGARSVDKYIAHTFPHVGLPLLLSLLLPPLPLFVIITATAVTMATIAVVIAASTAHLMRYRWSASPTRTCISTIRSYRKHILKYLVTLTTVP